MNSEADKITLTREELNSWLNRPENTAPHVDAFQTLKAHLEKSRRPKRREGYIPKHLWSHAERKCDLGDSAEVRIYLYPHKDTVPDCIHVIETFPGDIVKSKEEAREWVLKAFEAASQPGYASDEKKCFRDRLFEALGLGDEK